LNCFTMLLIFSNRSGNGFCCSVLVTCAMTKKVVRSNNITSSASALFANAVRWRSSIGPFGISVYTIDAHAYEGKKRLKCISSVMPSATNYPCRVIRHTDRTEGKSYTLYNVSSQILVAKHVTSNPSLFLFNVALRSINILSRYSVATRSILWIRQKILALEELSTSASMQDVYVKRSRSNSRDSISKT